MIGDGGNPKLHEVNAGHAKSMEAVKKSSLILHDRHGEVYVPPLNLKLND